MSTMPWSQEHILGWPAYPIPRLDRKVLSRLTEYDDVITWPPFTLASGPPNLMFTTDQKRVNIKSAIEKASTMTSCSTAKFAAISMLQIKLPIIEIFTSTCAGMFYDLMVALIQSRSLELHYQQFKTYHLNESSILNCQLKSEHNY